MFRREVASLLERASSVSVSSPLGGVSIAARVVGLLAAADRGRGTASPRAAATASADLFWIDDRPEGGQAERAALAAVGIAATVLGRPDDAAGRHARVVVLAGCYAAGSAGDTAARPAATLLVLYPSQGDPVTVPADTSVVVCRDAASLFVAVASRFG